MQGTYTAQNNYLTKKMVRWGFELMCHDSETEGLTSCAMVISFAAYKHLVIKIRKHIEFNSVSSNSENSKKNKLATVID